MTIVTGYADAIMAMIAEDVAAGIVPATVASFAELHDYLDANGYAEDAGVPFGPAGHEYDAVNAVEAEVSRRLAERQG